MDAQQGRTAPEPPWEGARRERRRAPMLVVALLAVLAGLVVGGGVPLSGVADDDLSVRRSGTPLDVDGPGSTPDRGQPPGAECTRPDPVAGFTLDGVRVAFVAGHPQRPLSPPPQVCLASASAARAAGFRPVDLPPGSEQVEGVVISDLGDRLVHGCRHAAGVLDMAVPCPSALPTFLSTARCDPQPVGRNDCAVDVDGDGPDGFATGGLIPGLEGRSADPRYTVAPGLLLVTASHDPRSAFVACGPDEMRVDAPLPEPGVVDCPVPAAQVRQVLPHAGRRTERLRIDGVWVAVSVGTADLPLDAVRRRVVDELVLVPPPSP